MSNIPVLARRLHKSHVLHTLLSFMFYLLPSYYFLYISSFGNSFNDYLKTEKEQKNLE